MAWAANEASASSAMALVALPVEGTGDADKVDTRWCGGLSSASKPTSKTTMIDKIYQPSEVEGRIYRTWEEAGAFKADRPGVFPMYCTEFCSALHLEMAGYLLVEPAGGSKP